jgi:membrane protein
MAEWVERLKQRPSAAHLLRAIARFNARYGLQFGAAITYFSVLAVVPVFMLAFSIAGFVLTIVRPDLLEPLAATIADSIGSGDPATEERIQALIQRAFSSYKAIGVVGLVSALYSGAGWMGNLKRAIRVQWRERLERPKPAHNYVVRTLINLATLLGLIFAVAVTFALASLSTSLAGSVIDWMDLNHIGWLEPVLRLVPIAFSISAGWLLFMYLFTVLPERREPWKPVRRGALMGAVGLAILQYLTSFLLAQFSGSPSALLFGPVIAVMVFFNLFSQLILFIAAWIVTDRDEAVDLDQNEAAVQQVAPPPEVSDYVDAPATVSQKVAAQSVRAGMRAGYFTGAATGAGVGAALAYVLAALRGHGRSKDKSG